MNEQIKYDGVGSYDDFGYIMTAHDAPIPSKRTAYVERPFASGSYDFSDVYGVRYDMREASITFERGFESRAAAIAGNSAFVAWLLGMSGEVFDTELGVGVGFTGARVTDVNSSVTGCGLASVTASIVAQPYLTNGGL